MKILGVHFAPLSVPRERRLQTLAMVTWCCIFLWTVPITILILYHLLFHSNYLWPFALMYIAWCFYDLDVCNEGGRRYVILLTSSVQVCNYQKYNTKKLKSYHYFIERNGSEMLHFGNIALIISPLS